MLFCSLPVCPVSLFPKGLGHLRHPHPPHVIQGVCVVPLSVQDPASAQLTHTQETPLILSTPARALMQTRPRPCRPLLLAYSQSAPSASCTPRCASGFPVSASQGPLALPASPPTHLDATASSHLDAKEPRAPGSHPHSPLPVPEAGRPGAVLGPCSALSLSLAPRQAYAPEWGHPLSCQPLALMQSC